MRVLRAGLALAAALALPVSGCGWERLYADPQSSPAAAELRAIRVTPIIDRIGQQLEISLRDSLNPTGIPTHYRYTLTTALVYSLSSLGIQSQGTASLGQIEVRTTSILGETSTGQNLLTISLHAQNSFELNPNQYSTVVAESDAGSRTVAELNREIVTRLDIFLQHRLAERAAKTAAAVP
jgi:hypothetical protein